MDAAVPVLQRLRSKGIGGILDYAAEADVAEGSGHAAMEAAAEQNLARLLESVAATKAAAHNTASDAFVAAKLTALIDPEHLKQVRRGSGGGQKGVRMGSGWGLKQVTTKHAQVGCKQIHQ